MTDELLDTPLSATYNDRRLLHLVMRSLQLDQGLDYMTALERFHDASDAARNAGTPTLGAALKWLGADAGYIADGVKLLDQRDAAVQSAYEKAAKPFMLEQTDPRGMVLLDQDAAGGRAPKGTATDIGKALTDPAEQERRFARMKKLSASYRGPEGRKQFLQDDRMYLEAGVDMVRSAERAVEETAARAKADDVARRLDTAIESGADKRQRLLLLEAEVDRVTESTRAERERLKVEVSATDQQRLMLLDQSAPKSGKDKTKRDLDKRVRKRMQRLGLPERDYVIALEQEARGDPMPPRPATERDGLSAPPGVYPASHGLELRIRERMKLLDRPQSDYVKTLEEIMAEDTSGRMEL